MFPCDINMFPCDSNMFPCDINSIEDRFDLHRVDRACDIPEVRIRKETENGLIVRMPQMRFFIETLLMFFH